jgi:hypothetical protein
VLLAAFIYHPYIANLTDKAAVTVALTSDTTHWGLSHLAVGVGSGLAVLAFLAVRSYLREAGEERWSILGLPFIVMGSTLFAFLPAMEIAMLAAAETGADVEAVQTALDSWFFPILLTAAVIFALGVLGFAMGIVRSGVLSPQLTWLVVGALVVIAAARFVPWVRHSTWGARLLSWHCGHWHTRCGSIRRRCNPRDSRYRRPDDTSHLWRLVRGPRRAAHSPTCRDIRHVWKVTPGIRALMASIGGSCGSSRMSQRQICSQDSSARPTSTPPPRLPRPERVLHRSLIRRCTGLLRLASSVEGKSVQRGDIR